MAITVTLVYSSHDEEHNNAVALKEYLQAKRRRPSPRGDQPQRIDRERIDEYLPHESWPSVIIRPIPPFRLDFTVWALRRRPRNAIDRWDGTTYRRIVMIGRRVTELAIRQSGSSAVPRVIVTAMPSLRTLSDRRQVESIVDRLLGLQIDLSEWYRVAHRDRRLAELADRFRGVKPPRFPTVFEALVNAFACQQLSLVVGLELLNRLAAVCDVRRRTGEPAQVRISRAARCRASRPASITRSGSAARRCMHC